MSLSADFPTTRPSLLLDFLNTQALDPRITFTRATSATYFDAAGVLRSAPAGQARFDFNPSTLTPLGLLIEEQRTNSIRNNTGQGAVAGSPGTLPTHWSVFAASGLTTTVVGTGTSNGITYIDLRFSGTSTNTFYVIAFDNSPVAASAGQSWTESFWVSTIGGSTSNINSLNLNIRWSSGVAETPFTSTATFTRLSATAIAPAAITNVVPALFINMVNGAAIDITLRIGLPQLELGSFATSVIPTTTAAATRNADVASMTGTNFSSWYRQDEGALYSESIVARQVSAGGTGVFTISDGTANNQHRILYRGTGATQGATATNNTVASDLTPTGVLSANAVVKIAYGYKTDNFAASGNGAVAVTDTGGTLPVVNQTLIGLQTNYLNGTIRKLSYYPFRLTNEQLQALTS